MKKPSIPWGVTGHEGLFSDTDDLALLLQVMLNRDGYGEEKLFDQPTIDAFTSPSEINPTYGLGWRRNGDRSMTWMFGPFHSYYVLRYSFYILRA
jgi:serine-type D-Ala-D-Ala carboxypeptidase